MSKAKRMDEEYVAHIYFVIWMECIRASLVDTDMSLRVDHDAWDAEMLALLLLQGGVPASETLRWVNSKYMVSVGEDLNLQKVWPSLYLRVYPQNRLLRL